MKKMLVVVSILAIIGVALVAFDFKFIYNFVINDRKYEQIIRSAAKKYAIDHRLVKAVIYQESRFNTNATGRAGEIGLMQLMPKSAVQDWAAANGVASPLPGLLFSPELNIEIGTWYLSRAMKRWQNYDAYIELALCQYNAGESRADSWKPASYDGEVVPFIKIKSTKEYVTTIMRRYQEYQKKDKAK
jgi:soluble lytic murein transglycosylase